MINGLNLFMYCSNNPVMLTDESGKAWWDWLIVAVLVIAVVVAVVAVTIVTGGVATTILAGAAIGMVTGGVTSVVSQVASGQPFSWAQLGVDMFFGALTGAVGGSALGVLGSALAMGASSFASSMVSDLVTTGKVDYGKAAFRGIVGAAMGASAGAQHGLTGKTKSLTKSLSNVKKKISNGGYSSRGGNGALNLVGYQLKNQKNILKFKSFNNLISNLLNNNNSMNIMIDALMRV